MEKKTKHGEWQGHRLFCNCEDDFSMTTMENSDIPDEIGQCPACGLYPWFYLNPADEPKQEG